MGSFPCRVKGDFQARWRRDYRAWGFKITHGIFCQFKDSVGPITRGTVLGFLIGIIPGSAHIISTFVSYALERRISKHPERFGKGAIEGVAGPESANNAGAQTSFIPLLTLGIPSNVVMALMIGALMIQGIAPGPQVMNEMPKRPTATGTIPMPSPRATIP